MRVLTDLTALEILKANDWIILDESPQQVRAFKWGPNTTRHEVCIRFDRAGRVCVWSHWENRRVSIDGEDGRRARVEEFIKTHNPRAVWP